MLHSQVTREITSFHVLQVQRGKGGEKGVHQHHQLEEILNQHLANNRRTLFENWNQSTILTATTQSNIKRMVSPLRPPLSNIFYTIEGRGGKLSYLSL